VLHQAAEAGARRVGGRARLRIVVLFAGVEALASADQATVGAVAPQLEHALHIANGQIAVIAAIAAAAGALGTIPAGVLTDRVRRVRLLAGSVVLWSAAMLASAAASSFLILVLTRILLGSVTATAGPTIASLIGDYFPAGERAQMWGLILTGELLGGGIGVVGSGNLAGVLSWRYGFGWLAVPGLVLALGLRTLLVEPARGGQSRLEPGADELIPAEEAPYRNRVNGRPSGDDPRELAGTEQELARRAAREQGEEPDPDLVLREDPIDMPLSTAARYVLRIRTNAVLILASAMGYLFFAGVETFAVLLLRSRYDLSQSAASSLLILVGLGAVGGAVLAGRLADRFLHRGVVNARVIAGAIGYLAAAAIFLPGLASPLLIVSMPLFVLGAAALAAPSPPLNAARLDVMHGRALGRSRLHLPDHAGAGGAGRSDLASGEAHVPARRRDRGGVRRGNRSRAHTRC
jgi:predicted MFS family arabinose efflux permease